MLFDKFRPIMINTICMDTKFKIVMVAMLSIEPRRSRPSFSYLHIFIHIYTCRKTVKVPEVGL